MSYLYNPERSENGSEATGLYGDPRLRELAFADPNSGGDNVFSRFPELQVATSMTAETWRTLQQLMAERDPPTIAPYQRSDPRSVLVDPRWEADRDLWRYLGGVLGTGAGGAPGLFVKKPISGSLRVLSDYMTGAGAVAGLYTGQKAGGRLYDWINRSKIDSGGTSTPQGWTFGIGGP